MHHLFDALITVRRVLYRVPRLHGGGCMNQVEGRLDILKTVGRAVCMFDYQSATGTGQICGCGI